VGPNCRGRRTGKGNARLIGESSDSLLEALIG
jgi:hypothetical protein